PALLLDVQIVEREIADLVEGFERRPFRHQLARRLQRHAVEGARAQAAAESQYRDVLVSHRPLLFRKGRRYSVAARAESRLIRRPRSRPAAGAAPGPPRCRHPKSAMRRPRQSADPRATTLANRVSCKSRAIVRPA